MNLYLDATQTKVVLTNIQDAHSNQMITNNVKNCSITCGANYILLFEHLYVLLLSVHGRAE